MALFDKEHYDMIEAFERAYSGSFRMDKEDKSLWAKGHVYPTRRKASPFRAGI